MPLSVSSDVLVLAIDTATAVLSLALHNGYEVISEITWRAPGHHTQEVPPRVHEILQGAGFEPRDLTAIAVALGPGSYTGLRIGMSLAKGIAMGCEPPIPLIGVPTLDIVASAQPHLGERLIVVTQAGRGRVNAAAYEWDGGWKAVETPYIATWQDLKARIELPTQIAGELDAAGRSVLAELGDRVMIASPAQSLRRAGHLADIAVQRIAAGQVDDPATLAPIYFH